MVSLNVLVFSVLCTLPVLISADSRLLEEAQNACASVQGPGFHLCVEDIVETGDMGMATFWVETEDHEEFAMLEEDRDLLEQARKACAKVQSSSDFDQCVNDVTEAQNLGLAELWPKQETATLTRHEQLAQKARVACAKVTGTGFEACLRDVMTTNDLRLANLWSQTEERQRLRGGSKSRLSAFW